MSRLRSHAIVLVAGLTLSLSACAATTGEEDDPVATDSVRTPGDLESTATWEPAPSSTSVDPSAVQSAYAPVLADAVSALGSGLRWTDAETTIETFEGRCVVKVERIGTGAQPTSPDAASAALTEALANTDFSDLGAANDPGGAILFVAHDPKHALFEFRSKGQSTVAVRVVTAESDCG